GLPEHPLYNDGYKSIGCAPCTSAVGEGEDFRAGRWRGRNKSECGIHFDFNGSIAKPVSQSQLTLFKDGRFLADPWRDRAEGEAPDETRYAHVTLSDFVADRAAFLASPHPIGLRIEPGDRVEDIGADVERFASIAINFPAFTDGRGYSSARLLRERMGFTGELRAVGD